MKNPLKWIRDAWLILGSTLVLVLILDAVLKSWLPEQAGWETVVEGADMPARERADALADSDWAVSYFSELKAARHTNWVPYTHWQRRPFQGTYIQIDAAGQRRTWQENGADGPRIWVFGGSTVWGTGARDDHTLPSELARALQERGMRARVINLGESGYVSTQGVVRLVRLLQNQDPPDAVVFYDGVNDVFAALQAGEAGGPQNAWERRSDFRATNGLDNWLAAFPRTLEGFQRLLGRAEPPEAEPLAQEIAATYRANVRTVRSLGQGLGFDSFFFWQPTVFSKQTRSASEEAVVAASLAAHRDLQLAANRAIAGAAEPIDDLSGLLDDRSEPLYLDFCHLSEAGNALVARAMADRIYAALASDS